MPSLPTGGSACTYSGMSLDSFLKKISLQHLKAEGPEAHARTIRIQPENMYI